MLACSSCVHMLMYLGLPVPCDKLQELVLDRNRIRYIDPDAFLGLSRLRELRLEDNGLRSLANLHTLSSLQVKKGNAACLRMLPS